jgi:hypothetical protein
MWHASKESLPTKYNLAKRKFLLDPICDTCHEGHDDVLHALWSCPLIQSAWTPEAWLNSVKPTPVQDFADLVLKILNVGDNQQRAKFGIICWALWHHRNKARLNKPMEHIKQINTFAQSYLEEFTHCNSGHDPIPLPRTQIKWKAPTTCRYKINYDGAVFRDRDEAGLGVVVRDAQGLPMASLASQDKAPLVGRGCRSVSSQKGGSVCSGNQYYEGRI